jgi:hypothetical protein
MVSVALLGLATVQFDGLPVRFPKEIRSLISATNVYNYDLGSVDYPPTEGLKNSAGPLLVAYGDSHAWHLQEGLRRLQISQTFRFVLKQWSVECVPMVAEVKRSDDETCRTLMSAERRYFEQVKPDIVVIAGHWLRYKQIDKLSEIIQFFQQIDVPRIVVIGSVPYWFQFPQLTLYGDYISDPLHRIPERLFGFAKATLEIDSRLKEITARLGVRYISAYDVLCNEDGCLARLGDTAKDIVQFDMTHLTPAGSRYLVSHIADQIFN